MTRWTHIDGIIRRCVLWFEDEIHNAERGEPLPRVSRLLPPLSQSKALIAKFVLPDRTILAVECKKRDYI